MKTVNELIKELQNLKPSLRELPILIVAPNGLTFEPKAKVLMRDKQTMFDEPKEMVITYDQQFLLFLLRVMCFFNCIITKVYVVVLMPYTLC